MNARRTHSARRDRILRLALALSLLLAIVPGQGLVLCIAGAGEIALGIGGDCPTDAGHADPEGVPTPCDDLHVDGLRQPVPPDVAADLDVDDALVGAVAMVLERTCGPGADAPAGVAPRSRSMPPALQRALDARRCVVLTI